MTSDHKEKLYRATEIHDRLVDGSSALDQLTKQAFKNVSKLIRDFLVGNPKAGSYQLRTLTNELLSHWNESIQPETEVFWMELRNNKIDFERKEPLRFALEKKRFRTVEHGIDARNYWEVLKSQNSISGNFTKIEIGQIDNIIENDEKKRLAILKKCLGKGLIPQTQYLKFGECMAYFARCSLFDKYFTSEEVKQLYEIWKNFK